MSWYKNVGECLWLYIYTKPSSSKNSITGLYGERSRLAISLKAPPVDGAANKELIKFLSKQFNASKSSFSLEKGETSKQKIVKIRQDCDRILSEIKTLIGEDN